MRTLPLPTRCSPCVSSHLAYHRPGCGHGRSDNLLSERPRLGFDDQLIQLLFQAYDSSVSCLFHLIQLIQGSADLTLGAGNRVHGLADLIANGPVSKKPVKEIVRKPQEAIDINLHIGSDLDVCQLGFEPSELTLERPQRILCNRQSMTV